jgi:hypothetical protein
MGPQTPRDFMMTVAPRVVDLRSEFEAQLRSVGRLEHQLTKSVAGRDPANRELSDVLRRELEEMLKNNQNIRDVLVELATLAGAPIVDG